MQDNLSQHIGSFVGKSCLPKITKITFIAGLRNPRGDGRFNQIDLWVQGGSQIIASPCPVMGCCVVESLLVLAFGVDEQKVKNELGKALGDCDQLKTELRNVTSKLKLLDKVCSLLLSLSHLAHNIQSCTLLMKTGNKYQLHQVIAAKENEEESMLRNYERMYEENQQLKVVGIEMENQVVVLSYLSLFICLHFFRLVSCTIG